MSVGLGSRISTYALLLLVGGRATLQQETTSTIHTVWPNSTAWTLGDGSPLQWSDSSTTACGPFAQLDGTEMVLTFNGTDVTLQGYGIKPDNAPVFGLSAYLDDGNRLYFDVPNRDTIAGGCSTFATYRNLEPDKVHTLRINIDSSAILHYWMGPAEVTLSDVRVVSSTASSSDAISTALTTGSPSSSITSAISAHPKDTRQANSTERRRIVVGSAVGAFALLCIVIITALLVRRRFLARATALNQPRALPPPSSGVPTRDRNPLKGKEAFLAVEPTPDARLDDPEHGESESSRLRAALDALAALQNEVQEMRKRDTLGVETLPDYEPRGVGRE